MLLIAIALDSTRCAESVSEIRWAKKTLVDSVIEIEVKDDDEIISHFLTTVECFDLVKKKIFYIIYVNLLSDVCIKKLIVIFVICLVI